jgi:thiol-disulfide isomerase/thioredoxin
MKKNIQLVIALVVIAGIIWYLQGLKAAPFGNGPTTGAVPVTLPTEDTIVASTSSSAPASTSSPSQNAVRPEMSSGGGSASGGKLADVISADRAKGYKIATELAGPTGFINTPPFKLTDIVGKKVILVDFWTYSCINCIRTLPYLTTWYKKYQDAGLEIVGVHTPEFEFEKDISNVTAAAKKYGITYPVVLDSNHDTWNAYGNLYWPHEYLIDIGGYVVDDHIGEGGYAETEGLIQKLLKQRATVLGTSPVISGGTSAVSADAAPGTSSPETYFGSARNEFLANGTQFTPGLQNLSEPVSINVNELNLVGNWNFTDEFATTNASDTKIIYKYNASKVFFVGSALKEVAMEVLQDGKPVGIAAGQDVKNGKVMIKESRLYDLINNPDSAGEHTLELIIDSPGLQAYTFTFG